MPQDIPCGFHSPFSYLIEPASYGNIQQKQGQSQLSPAYPKLKILTLCPGDPLRWKKHFTSMCVLAK